jgi:hypothetical protein
LQDEVVAAHPEIDQRVEGLVSKGRWNVPGYKVSYPKNGVLQQEQTNTHNRRSSATCRRSRGEKSSGSCCCAIVSFVHNRTVFFFAFHTPLLLQLHISSQPSSQAFSAKRAAVHSSSVLKGSYEHYSQHTQVQISAYLLRNSTTTGCLSLKRQGKTLISIQDIASLEYQRSNAKCTGSLCLMKSPWIVPRSIRERTGLERLHHRVRDLRRLLETLSRR